MAGVLDHIREITVFLNPLTNSYARFGAFEALGTFPGLIKTAPS